MRSNPEKPLVAVVDYGMGNLFSVRRACAEVGLRSMITTDKRVIRSAHAVILPGVGAFPHAMAALRRLGLVDPLREAAVSGKPLLGICLGMQLLMSESCEFRITEGLGIIEGSVIGFGHVERAGRRLKVPHVGWNAIQAECADGQEHTGGPRRKASRWSRSPLEGLTDGSLMYFVHSFYTVPRDRHLVMSTTCYGDVKFCSSLQSGRVFACQFHPERSGPLGLRIYWNLARSLQERVGFEEEDDVVVNITAAG